MRNSLKLRLHYAKKTFCANWTLYLLVLPAFIYLFLFNYMPMYGVQIAFRNFRPKKGITGSDWVGLKHFIKFFNYPAFWQLLGNTLTISLWSMVSFPMSVLLALMINEVQNAKFKRTVQMVTYMPHFISTVFVVALVRLMFARATGVVNPQQRDGRAAGRLLRGEHECAAHLPARRQRMEHAKMMLKGGKSVAETCEKVCYASRSHFIKTFTNYVGMTPSRYRDSDME